MWYILQRIWTRTPSGGVIWGGGQANIFVRHKIPQKNLHNIPHKNQKKKKRNKRWGHLGWWPGQYICEQPKKPTKCVFKKRKNLISVSPKLGHDSWFLLWTLFGAKWPFFYCSQACPPFGRRKCGKILPVSKGGTLSGKTGRKNY